MKVLILANGDSIWTKNIIDQTLLCFGDEVTLISRSKVEKYSDFYKHRAVNVIPYSLKELYKEVQRDYYDIFCLHFVLRKLLLSIPIAKHFCKKTIIVFWGSDILRVHDDWISKYLKRFTFNLADNLCINTKALLEPFHKLYGLRYDSKIRLVGFGSNNIEIQKGIIAHKDIKQLKEKCDIDDSKIVIAIGYNNSKEQQHIKVLDAIKTFPRETMERIHLILRLTYGNGGEDYIARLKGMVKECGCTYTLFESHLSDEEIAETCLITDIFIHAQITDARSASMQEYLYAKCLVFNPSWIDYSELKDKAFFLTYNSFDELKILLLDNLVSKADSPYREDLEKNSNGISAIASWDSYVPMWREIYTNET